MGKTFHSPDIKITLLHELQHLFQKEAGELIEIYLEYAKKKISVLNKALQGSNIGHFKAAAQELRMRSIDIGAVQFSYYCLCLEIAVQEMSLERLPSLTQLVEDKFTLIYQELKQLSKTNRSV